MATLAETTRRLRDDLGGGLRQLQDIYTDALAVGDDQGAKDAIRGRFDAVFTRLDALVSNINFDTPDQSYPSTVTRIPEPPNDSPFQPAMSPNANIPRDVMTGDVTEVGNADPAAVNPDHGDVKSTYELEREQWEQKVAAVNTASDEQAAAAVASIDGQQGPVPAANLPYANEQPHGANNGDVDPNLPAEPPVDALAEPAADVAPPDAVAEAK